MGSGKRVCGRYLGFLVLVSMSGFAENEQQQQQKSGDEEERMTFFLFCLSISASSLLPLDARKENEGLKTRVIRASGNSKCKDTEIQSDECVWI